MKRAKTGKEHKSCTRCGEPRVEARGFCRPCYDKARNRTRLTSGAVAANGRQPQHGATMPEQLPEVCVPLSLLEVPCRTCGAPPIFNTCLICIPEQVPAPFTWPVVQL